MAVVIPIGLWVLLICINRSPVAGVVFVAVVNIIDVFVGSGAVDLGFNVTPDDLCFIILGCVTFVRIVIGNWNFTDAIYRYWLVLGFVWILMFGIGLVQYKSIAGVQFRDFFYLWTAVSYVMTFRLSSSQISSLLSAFFAAGLTMGAIAAVRWGLIANEIYGEWYDYHTPLRVLSSANTQLIASAALVGIAMWLGLLKGRPSWMLGALLLLLSVVILGHRTVWVAGAAAIGFAWWLSGRQDATKRAGIALPIVVGVLFVGGFFAVAPESTVSQELTRSVSETSQQHSTLAWRQDSWKSLIADWAQSGPAVWLGGKPFGSDNSRYIESQGMKTRVTAHNHYVAVLVNGGAVGLASFLAALVIAFRRLYVFGPNPVAGFRPEILLVLLAFFVVYGIGYSLDYLQGLMIGMVFALAANQFVAREGEHDCQAEGICVSR